MKSKEKKKKINLIIALMIITLIIISFVSYQVGRYKEQTEYEKNFNFLMNTCKEEVGGSLYLQGDKTGVKSMGCVILHNNIKTENMIIKEIK